MTGFLLALCILPLLIYQAVSYSTTRQAIIELATQHSMQLLSNQRDYLNLLMEQIDGLAANLGSLDEIKQALVASDGSSGAQSVYDVLATKARIGYLLSSYSSLNGLVSIDLFALKGTHYHVGDTLDAPDEHSELLDSLMQRTFAVPGQIVWHGVEDNVNESSTSRKVVVASKSINRADSTWLKTELAGMMLISYSTDHLYEHFSTVSMGAGAYLLVVDAQKRLLFHPDKRLIGQPLTGGFSGLLHGDSGTQAMRLDERDVLLSYVQIPDKQWYLISVVPQSTLTASMVNIKRTGIAALLLSLLLIAVYIRRYSLRVVAPIRAISDGFKCFQANQLDPAWRLTKPGALDEISELVSWFNAFLDTMQMRRQSETALRIAAIAFESQEGMMITDANSAILQVNRSFTKITGYSAEEVVGRNVELLKSGRHDIAFYAAMQNTIERTGIWEGEVWSRRKNGETYPEWLTITEVQGDDGNITHYVRTMSDITQRKATENKIQLLAYYDSLTKLPNRQLLIDRLQQALLDNARSKRQCALLFIDLDNFKTINDTLGHDKGDLLLQQVAQRLSGCVRAGDTVARQGGDEFVVMLRDLSETPEDAAGQARIVAGKILTALNQPYQLAGHLCRNTPSIGITLFDGHLASTDDLLKRADLAMYQAKAAGRNTLRFFEPDMQASVTARAELETDLRQGLQDHQFLLYYQAQVDDAGRVTGAEVLVRWRHPRRGLVPPAEFIPAAEDTGMILPLGHWVLETACRQQAIWASRPEMAHLVLAVNVSAHQFRQPDFVAQVLQVLDRSGANAHRLKLELTESLLLDDVEDIIAKMWALKARGVGFSLDDFGTGYSSLSYLKRLPLDQLKIDQSFVRDIHTDPNDAAIVRTIVALAQSLGLSVIAEGVETEAQSDFLASNGCHAYQGYLYSKPLPLDAFEQFLVQVSDALEGAA